MREERRRARIIKNLLYVVLVLAIAGIGFGILMNTVFIITTTDITGCENADAKEVMEAVSQEPYSDNSLLLFLQLKSGKVPDVDFVESVSLRFVTPWHVCLNVTEKTVYGVIRDTQSMFYTYFDSSGTVVEVTETAVSDVMELSADVSGDAAEGERLNLVPEGSLDYVTDVFALIDTYDLSVDTLYLDTSGEIYFNTSGITILLGGDENTAEKFENLALIIDQLEGLSGTLDLSTFSGTGDDIIFTEE